MSGPMLFFLAILAMQAGFVAVMILVVGRRFPQRRGIYRWAAPALLPLLLFSAATWTYLRVMTGPVSGIPLAPVARLALVDGTLWMAGVVLASLLIRLGPR